jgi:hypothetical protein
MAWKIEKWLSEVFPGEENIYSAYRDLPPRELAIVAGAVIDTALAELISKRLVDMPGECERFLGANDDGRAPAQSFGARIQLGLLIGLIREADARAFRAIKKIRNKFAHRVGIGFCDDDIVKETTKLVDRLAEMAMVAAEKDPGSGFRIDLEAAKRLKASLSTEPEAGAGVLLVTLTYYNAFFHLLHDKIVRVGHAPWQ